MVLLFLLLLQGVVGIGFFGVAVVVELDLDSEPKLGSLNDRELGDDTPGVTGSCADGTEFLVRVVPAGEILHELWKHVTAHACSVLCRRAFYRQKCTKKKIKVSEYWSKS